MVSYIVNPSSRFWHKTNANHLRNVALLLEAPTDLQYSGGGTDLAAVSILVAVAVAALGSILVPTGCVVATGKQMPEATTFHV